MNVFEFMILLNENIISYLLSLLIASFLFFKILFNKSNSWFNPVRLNILNGLIGYSVILFLLFTKNLTYPTFFYVSASYFIFWITFKLLFNNKQYQLNFKIKNEKKISLLLFYTSYLIFLLLTIFSYYKLGIPLINELEGKSRLMTYDKSGLGFIGRILPVFYSYTIFYLIYLFNKKEEKNNFFKIIVLFIPIILFGVLSGSRSSFFYILTIFWGFSHFIAGNEPKLSNYKIVIIPFLILSLSVFSIQYSANIFYSIYLFFERVVASGDIYYEALPNDNWKNIKINNSFNYTFMGILGPLRILNNTQFETPIGFQLTSLVFTGIKESNTGPVAHYPIHGLVNFGYLGGVFFSFIQSIILCFFLKITYIKTNSLLIGFIAIYGFISLTFFFADITASFGVLLDYIINSLIIIFLIIFLSAFKK